MVYLALLRGINVGGKNIITMADLRTCFINAGYTQVHTYIQSGNVLFSATTTDAGQLETTIEQTLEATFGYTGAVVVLSATELCDVVAEAPKHFGAKPDTYRYNVFFLKRPLAPQAAAKDIVLRDGVDTLHIGSKSLYTTRLIARAGNSLLSKITTLSHYQSLTIRNWNTTTRLCALAQEIT